VQKAHVGALIPSQDKYSLKLGQLWLGHWLAMLWLEHAVHAPLPLSL